MNFQNFGYCKFEKCMSTFVPDNAKTGIHTKPIEDNTR